MAFWCLCFLSLVNSQLNYVIYMRTVKNCFTRTVPIMTSVLILYDTGINIHEMSEQYAHDLWCEMNTIARAHFTNMD